MALVASSSRPLPGIGKLGPRQGPWMAELPAGGLERISTARSDASSQSVALRAGSYAMRRRQNVNALPWESPAVQNFAASLSSSSSGRSAAMILEGRQGTVLQAVGEIEDHKVAGSMVAEIQKEANNSTSARQDSSALARLERGQRAPIHQQRIAFGAVYEHRDSAGKPRLVSSTATVPERQFKLDWENNPTVRDLCKAGNPPGSSAKLVWVGVGSGPVGDDQMSRVRQAVVDARAERLALEKLSSEKPYSRHT